MSDKKYGVIWAPTSNIGDEIQTLAAIEFLKQHGVTEYVPVDREALNKYNDHPITVIMNGWFIHDLKSFPPSDKITPIFISFHCSKPTLISDNIAYFKKHQPIGCRDTHTVSLFNKHGIDAYFTGCLTLILPESNNPRSGKLLVDAKDVTKKLSLLIPRFVGYKAITNTIPDNTRIHDFQYRLNRAKYLVDKFKNAKLVVTSRLHCALPCRALGTPVKFIHPAYHTDPRFTGLLNILQGSTRLEGCNESFDRRILKDKIDFFINYKI